MTMHEHEWLHQSQSDIAPVTTRDALSEREFEALYQGALSIPDDYQGQQARLLVLLTGRLGLRLGEVAHMQAEWIDWDNTRIDIPACEPCEQGIDDTICAYCTDRIAYIVDEWDVDRDEIADHWWRPKTRAAIRSVPYGWEPRTAILVERFFERFGEMFLSTTGISRRVTKAATHAPDIDPDGIYPGSLRATAASYHAARGLTPPAMQQLLGWCNIGSASGHITQSDQHTQQSLRDVHSV